MKTPLLIILLTLLGNIDIEAQGQRDQPEGRSQSYNRFFKLNLENPGDYSGLEELESYAKGPRVFMTGENHMHVAMNGMLEFKLLRFLHEKAGVRHLLLELGEARGWYANRYVNDIDSQERYCLQATTSVEHMKILENIRDWNRTLPMEQRIQIHGIDVERFNDIAVLRLSDMLPKTGVPKSLYSAVQGVHQAAGWILHSGLKEFETTEKNETNANTTPPFSLDQSIDLILRHFDSLKTELNSWLGSRHELIQSGIEGLREYKQWNQYRNSAFYYTWREENIFRKLRRLLDSDTSARFFGQFGRCHTAYSIQDGDCGWYAYQSVIHKLQERYFLSKNKVLSIGIFYADDREINADENSINDQELKAETKRLLNHAPAGEVSIIRLANDQNNALAERFGFLIAVRKNIADQKKQSNKTSTFQLFTGISLNSFSQKQNIVNHVNPTIKGIKYGHYPLSVGANWYNKNFTAGTQFSMSLPTELYQKKDELSIKYSFQSASAYAGWRFINMAGLSADIGPQIFHATEILSSKRLYGGFLTPAADPVKMVRNHAAGVGFQSRLQCRILPFMQIGFSAGYLLDLSAPDWFISKTNIHYAPNQLKTQITGSSFSVFFNFDL